jgi:hypothetical protein
MALARWQRRRIASVVAVPVRIAVMYLIIESYWSAIRSYLMGRDRASFRRLYSSGLPACVPTASGVTSTV